MAMILGWHWSAMRPLVIQEYFENVASFSSGCNRTVYGVCSSLDLGSLQKVTYMAQVFENLKFLEGLPHSSRPPLLRLICVSFSVLLIIDGFHPQRCWRHFIEVAEVHNFACELAQCSLMNGNQHLSITPRTEDTSCQ
jgi:hypothetical protein